MILRLETISFEPGTGFLGSDFVLSSDPWISGTAASPLLLTPIDREGLA